MSNSVCAIVGGGDGLGRALAARFAREGFTVVLLSRSAAGSAAALEAAEAAAPNGGHHWLAADATKPEVLEQALAQATASGPIEVLIYNPRGPYAPRAPLDMSYAELEENYQLEVLGALAAAKAVMPAMIEAGRGTVIYSSATAALRGSGTNAVYAIGKFGLRALSQSLAKAHAGDGVHVVHVRLDCTLDVPEIREYLGKDFDAEMTSNTDDVAETYWWVYQQPKSAWSNEIELRPYTEQWTY